VSVGRPRAYLPDSDCPASERSELVSGVVMPSQRFANRSQVALSLALREFSAMRSHSSALNRYSSDSVIVLACHSGVFNIEHLYLYKIEHLVLFIVPKRDMETVRRLR
jgi:hypothetical protein